MRSRGQEEDEQVQMEKKEKEKCLSRGLTARQKRGTIVVLEQQER